jgi:hypothetical protein
VAIVFVLNVISELILREKGEPEECLQENQVISACGDQRTSQFHFILHHTAFFMGHMGIVSYFLAKETRMSIMKHAEKVLLCSVPNCKWPFCSTTGSFGGREKDENKNSGFCY